jgi:DeoR/GlpR family transcriptional regulator of sugar metabolism
MINHNQSHCRSDRELIDYVASLPPQDVDKELKAMGLATVAQEIAQSHAVPREDSPAPDRTSFAREQESVDRDEKEIAAEWAIDNLPVRSGEGIVVDAGSSGLAVWRLLVERIRKGDPTNITVYSNSFQVLEHWRDNVMIPQVRETSVELIGSSLDAPHLAFYGPEARAKLMPEKPTFRPAAVFIGTSGIEFDEHGRMLFGYHAGDPELDTKKVFFECYAKKRIILATPRKIGHAVGRVFDVLSVKPSRAPIYLVMAEPSEESPYAEQFHRTRDLFKKNAQLHRSLDEQGLTIHWVSVKKEKSELKHEELIAPNDELVGRTIRMKAKDA